MFSKLSGCVGIQAYMTASRFVCLAVLFPALALCQQPSPDEPLQPGTLKKADSSESPRTESKRIFGIVPNFRTSPSLKNYEPLSTGGKFKLAGQDAWDRGTIVLAALFAGESQLTNASPSFGQGAAGYGRYFGTSYADYVIGDYMTEGIYPTLLHQDPRYFRRGTGTGRARLLYAMAQIFWTHKDSGGTQFNYSEVIGNSTAVAISQAYYPDNRTVSDAVSKLGTQIGVDMASNILKEFWPDVARKFDRKHRANQN
jgi:hypothetical protein